MALPNPKRKRRYNFKRQLKRKLRKITFIIVIAIISATFYGGSHYYKKYYNNPHLKEKNKNIQQQNGSR